MTVPGGELSTYPYRVMNAWTVVGCAARDDDAAAGGGRHPEKQAERHDNGEGDGPFSLGDRPRHGRDAIDRARSGRARHGRNGYRKWRSSSLA